MVDLIITFYYDSIDRIRNLDLVLDFLTRKKLFNIYVGCQFGKEFIKSLMEKYQEVKFIFYRYEYNFFHRTRIINDVFKDYVKSPIFCCYDCDVLFEKNDLINCIDEIKDNKFDLMYPFRGRAIYIGIDTAEELRNLNFDFSKIDFSRFCKSDDVNIHCGFSFFINSSKFRECGMMNENILYTGEDDHECLWRFKKFGCRVKFGNGFAYHIDHKIDKIRDIFQENNLKERKKVKEMNEKELRDYVHKFKWGIINV